MNALLLTSASLAALTGAGLLRARHLRACAPLYLDAQATTPLHPAVVRAMRHAESELWGNPGSPHAFGRAASAAVATARARVARLLGAPEARVVFTSGATEALNLALTGSLLHLAAQPGALLPLHVLTTAIEHKAVLQPLQALAAQGLVALELLPLTPDGTLTPEALRDRLRPDTALVALGWANNEIGTVQPLDALAAVLTAHPARLVVDATQAAGFAPHLPARVDAAALSAHKLHGPKGIGALVLPRALPLEPLAHGGGQEGGLRPGTLPVPLIVALGEAARLACAEAPRRALALTDAASAAWRRLAPLGLTLHGPPPGPHRLPGNLSLTLPEGLTVAALRRRAPSLAFSQGSACSCSKRGSHVLDALGLPFEAQQRTFRLGFHAALSARQVARAVQTLEQALRNP